MNEIFGPEMFANARGIMRVALAVIFILFMLCFIAIVVEETFLGGRRRRAARNAAREQEKRLRATGTPTADPAPRN
jgi:ABC-type Fe3+ transport system permease subunit